MIRPAPHASLLVVLALLFAGHAIADEQQPNTNECAEREAIAASIAKIESTQRAAQASALLAQIAVVEQRISNLQPVLFGTCPENLGIASLSGRLEKMRNAAQKIVTQERLRAVEDQRRREITAKPWPDDIKRAVIERKVQIGMTSEQVTLAWGRPGTINETIRAISREEQWVYPGPTYLYFANGTLTTIQRTR